MEIDAYEDVSDSETPARIPENAAFSFLSYKKGTLYFEGQSLAALAEKVGTPFYAYAQGALEATYDQASSALGAKGIGISYAVKANYNQSLLAVLAKKGAGADVVSIGEARRALAAGIPASRIIFSGAGKTADELAQALDLNLYQINVESLNELELLSRIAVAKSKKAPTALRINPDVDAKTISKVTTGKKGNKFGIDLCDALPVFERAKALPGIDLVGMAIHIGSQLVHIDPYRTAYAKTISILKQLRSLGYELPRLDLGGGLGVWYRDEDVADFAAWANVIAEAAQGLDVKINVEPGRALVAHAGIFVSRVAYVKQGSDRKFLILDAGMNDLMRPALYGSYHHILPVSERPQNAREETYDIVGPICESTDTFARGRALPAMKENELVAFLCAGAYGSSMSSTYNGHPLCPEILIKGDAFAVVRPRQTIEQMIAAEPKASWL